MAAFAIAPDTHPSETRVLHSFAAVVLRNSISLRVLFASWAVMQEYRDRPKRAVLPALTRTATGVYSEPSATERRLRAVRSISYESGELIDTVADLLRASADCRAPDPKP